MKNLSERLIDIARAQQGAREMEIVHDAANEIRAVMARPNPEPVNGHAQEWTPEQLAEATGRARYWIDQAVDEGVSAGWLTRWIGPGGTGYTVIANQ